MATYSIIQKSQLEGAHRIDAQYYQPEYLEIISNLNALKAVPINDIAVNPKRKFKAKKSEVFDILKFQK